MKDKKLREFLGVEAVRVGMGIIGRNNSSLILTRDGMWRYERQTKKEEINQLRDEITKLAGVIDRLMNCLEVEDKTVDETLPKIVKKKNKNKA